MKLFFFSAAVALSGCANLTVIEQARIEEARNTTPNLGVVASAPVGESLFTQTRYWRKTGNALASDVNASVGGGKVAALAGDFLFTAQVEGITAYCTERPTFGMILGPGKTACFSDSNNDGMLDKVWIASDVKWWSADLTTPVKFNPAEETIPRAEAMKRELIYQGYSKSVLKMSYREYINDLARPAFFQDVTYEISSFPAEVTFKASRLKIIGAGNSGIEYQVLAPF